MTAPKNTSPSVEVLVRFAAYNEIHPSWGSLHIVLDDENVEDWHVGWCIGYADAKGDEEGSALGYILLDMSESQRRKMANLGYEGSYKLKEAAP